MLSNFRRAVHATLAPICERGLEVMTYLTKCVEKATAYHYRHSQPR